MSYPRIFLPTVLAVLATAQGQNAEGTRQLYYLGPETPAAKTVQSREDASYFAFRPPLQRRLDARQHEAREEIASNRVLKEGDCFAIDLQSNRPGYLYVLAKQSSGSWMPLFPSPEMAGQRNEIEPFKKVEVPNGYCFGIHKPAGKETLFVVFSREKKDFFELYESVKAKQEKGSSAGSETQMADAKRVDVAVEHLDEKFGGTRDLSITRIGEPVKKDEPRGAVYVVHTSEQPSSSIITKIEVLHR